MPASCFKRGNDEKADYIINRILAGFKYFGLLPYWKPDRFWRNAKGRDVRGRPFAVWNKGVPA